MTHNRVSAGLNGFDAKRIVRERLNFHIVSLWRMQSVLASKISRVSLKELSYINKRQYECGSCLDS